VPRDTLIDFFRDLERARGSFLVYDDGFRCRCHTYAEVTAGARGFAARLHDLGLHKGDKVVFWSENRPEWVVAFWGCLLGGIVVVPVDYRASPDFLARVARLVSARLVLIGQDVPPFTDALDVSGATTWKLHELPWTGGTPPEVPIVADDVAEIIFTSGATAEPKGVLITHRNILANIIPIEREVLKYRKWAWPVSPIAWWSAIGSTVGRSSQFAS
jgi:long-chain acyl-CoA synthetase